nr:hypothetical protein [Capnocytophaga genosp. AHN8471]
MKHLIIFLLFPFLAAAQPIISCKDVIKPYVDFESPLAFEETVVVLQKNTRKNRCYNVIVNKFVNWSAQK